ncbi:MAG: MFS transporter [Gammaproteobacteria bacterium]|nr:MFS transporter [Gammaproteobacteria bacterium]
MIPYWRLSGFYFFHFGVLGIFLPYWSLYLKSLDFSAGAIGTLAALLVATKIVSPNLWGWVADHTGHRLTVIRVGVFLSAVAFSGALLTESYLGLAIVLIAFGFCWNAALPQIEATTMNHLQDRPHVYPKIRIWGSIGFILAVWVVGRALETQPLRLVPWMILGLTLLNAFLTLSLPGQPSQHEANAGGRLRDVLRRPEVIAVLVVCFLMQASHGPYYTFYSIYLEDTGYGVDRIGELWALGVMAEVVLFMFMHGLLKRYGLRILLIASLVLTALRWWLIGEFVDSLWILVLAQLLHAASFGLYHAVGIQLFHRYFTGRLQGRGQALYSSVSFGAGLAIGSWISGLTVGNR